MLFMVIERFKGRDPAPIYARLREHGRSLPEGLRYVDSWVEANFDRCFQLMECDDAVLLQRWVLEWRDLVEFEIVAVSPSGAVRSLFLSSLEPEAEGAEAAWDAEATRRVTEIRAGSARGRPVDELLAELREHDP
jgi:hypothetical protein